VKKGGKKKFKKKKERTATKKEEIGKWYGEITLGDPTQPRLAMKGRGRREGRSKDSDK